MDLEAVELAMRRACDYVRSGEGAYFIELLTYRFRAHSMFDAELYRSRQEVEAWRQRDPLTLYRALLLDRGWITERELVDLEREVDAEIADAVGFAERGSLEPVEELCKDVTTPRTGVS